MRCIASWASEGDGQAEGEHAGRRVLVALVVARIQVCRGRRDFGIHALVAGEREEVASGEVEPRVRHTRREPSEIAVGNREAEAAVDNYTVSLLLDVPV